MHPTTPSPGFFDQVVLLFLPIMDDSQHYSMFLLYMIQFSNALLDFFGHVGLDELRREHIMHGSASQGVGKKSKHDEVPIQNSNRRQEAFI